MAALAARASARFSKSQLLTRFVRTISPSTGIKVGIPGRATCQSLAELRGDLPDEVLRNAGLGCAGLTRWQAVPLAHRKAALHRCAHWLASSSRGKGSLSIFPEAASSLLKRFPAGAGSQRNYGILEDIAKSVRGGIDKNPELKKSIQELKEKADGLASRTKEAKISVLKKVDAVRDEASKQALKVTTVVQEKVTEATEQVKSSVDSLRSPRPPAPPPPSEGEGPASTGVPHDAPGEGPERSSEETGGKQEEAEPRAGGAAQGESVAERARRGWTAATAGAAPLWRRVKETKVLDALRQGVSIVAEELARTSPRKRRRGAAQPPPAPPPQNGHDEARSARSELVVTPEVKPSGWRKRWEDLKDKARQHPAYQRVSKFGRNPVFTKSQELAEDIRDRWETSDSPVVHKIQDLNESIFGETPTGIAMREIRRRDPSFSIPDFMAELQEEVRPLLVAYNKADVAALKSRCSREVIERSQAEARALQHRGLIADNRILHISDVEVRETKLMGNDPVIIISFRTQQIYCARNELGQVIEGGKDDIHTVFYAWAMQQESLEDLAPGQSEPSWRLREMQKLGIQALI